MDWNSWHNEYRKKKRRERGLKTANLRTHCPQGHSYAGDNLYVKPNGHRVCKECRRLGMIKLARSRGVKKRIIRTREEKLANRRKWESKRNALKKKAFIENIDPMIVFKRDNGICKICEVKIETKYELDHIMPLAKGGKHCYDNIQLAHPSCNRKKWAKVK